MNQRQMNQRQMNHDSESINNNLLQKLLRKIEVLERNNMSNNYKLI